MAMGVHPERGMKEWKSLALGTTYVLKEGLIRLCPERACEQSNGHTLASKRADLNTDVARKQSHIEMVAIRACVPRGIAGNIARQ